MEPVKDSKSLKDCGIMLLTEDISTATVKPSIEWIIEENINPIKRSKLKLYINSSGGLITASFGLTDFMEFSKIPIQTIGLGEICSCGLLIFMTGEKGTRTITKNTLILSHQYSWGSHGKEHELLGATKAFEITAKQIRNHYRKHLTVKKNKEKIIDFLLQPTDTWLTPEEAIKYGIADKIVEKM
jgi:ATP-dependent Clp protease protease subunit